MNRQLLRARRHLIVVPVLMVVSAAVAGCDIAMAELREKQTAEWRKTYDLQPGGRLEISNVNGKIEVQPAEGNAVEIVAEKSVRASTADAAKEALARPASSGECPDYQHNG